MSRPSLLARALLIKETESKLTTAENILEEELRKWRGIRPMPGVPPASYMSAMSSRDMLMTTLERAQKEFHPVSPDEVMEAVVKAQHSGI